MLSHKQLNDLIAIWLVTTDGKAALKLSRKISEEFQRRGHEGRDTAYYRGGLYFWYIDDDVITFGRKAPTPCKRCDEAFQGGRPAGLSTEEWDLVLMDRASKIKQRKTETCSTI